MAGSEHAGHNTGWIKVALINSFYVIFLHFIIKYRGIGKLHI